MKLKYKLPNYSKLKLKFDIDRLRKEVSILNDRFTDVYSANGKLCVTHHNLAADTYKFFDQIALTTNGKIEKSTSEECFELLNLNSVKNRIRNNMTDQGMSEKGYNIPTEIYKNSYFEEIIGSFKSPAIRVRITKLAAGKSLTPHIDYDPSYATRIIVPIYSEPECLNQFWRKNILEETWFEPDGSSYFLNTAIKHNVANNSNKDRIALMFSLDGIDDIEHLIYE